MGATLLIARVSYMQGIRWLRVGRCVPFQRCTVLCGVYTCPLYGDTRENTAYPNVPGGDTQNMAVVEQLIGWYRWAYDSNHGRDIMPRCMLRWVQGEASCCAKVILR